MIAIIIVAIAIALPRFRVVVAATAALVVVDLGIAILPVSLAIAVFPVGVTIAVLPVGVAIAVLPVGVAIAVLPVGVIAIAAILVGGVLLVRVPALFDGTRATLFAVFQLFVRSAFQTGVTLGLCLRLHTVGGWRLGRRLRKSRHRQGDEGASTADSGQGDPGTMGAHHSQSSARSVEVVLLMVGTGSIAPRGEAGKKRIGSVAMM